MGIRPPHPSLRDTFSPTLRWGRRNGLVVDFSGAERLRALEETHELTRIVNQHRQMLRADVDVPALISQGDQRHHVGTAFTEKAERFAHGSMIGPAPGLPV